MDKKLLEIIVCPVTKGPLIYDKENQLYLLLKEKIKPIENDILKATSHLLRY